MELVSDALGQLSDEDVVLITVIRNEVDILPAFLDHYSSLGICKFIVIDHDSTDGSQELFAGRDGTAVYHTTESYRDSIAGINWVNRLAAERCTNHWVLVVDADEFLILPPGIENIQAMRAKLESQLDLGLLCPMVDFFPGHLNQAAREGYATLDDLVSAASLFLPFTDAHLKVMANYPWHEYRTSKGIRAALSGQNKPSPRLTKIPLVFWKQGFRFEKATHVGSPLPLSFDNGVLAHFKFRPGFRQRMTRDQANRDRLDPLALTQFIDETITEWPEFIPNEALTYSTQTDLVTGGYLRDPGSPPNGFPLAWQKANISKSQFFAFLSGTSQDTPSPSDNANHQLERLLNSRTMRLTRPLRHWLYRRQLLRAHFVPDLIEQPATATQAMVSIYESMWWDIGVLLRLFGNVYRSIMWKNLFSLKWIHKR